MPTAKAKQLAARRKKIAFCGVIAVVLPIGLLTFYLSRHTISVLQPAGPIAGGEKRLLVDAFLLMLIIVVPVFALAFGFAWRYREANHAKAVYLPNWDHSRTLETIWWLIPTALITVIGVMTWLGTFAYAPSKQLVSSQKPLTIQAVALNWRWLFIYPDQRVASINEVHFPVGVPVKFEITADAPMNSFWIPQLGGQMYAMPGMNTTLYLQATKPGNYNGVSANISGKGFAGMRFTATASDAATFDYWLKRAAVMPHLTDVAYDSIANASTDRTVYTYSQPIANLYDLIIHKNMMHLPGIANNPNNSASITDQMHMEHM